MGRRVRMITLAALGALVVLAVWTASATAAVFVSKPALSSTPRLGVTFTVSGITTPTVRSGVAPVVMIKVLAPNDSGTYVVQRTVKARVVKRAGKPGYRYSRAITISMVEKVAFRAFRYAGGRVVGKSSRTYAEVTYGRGQLAHWRFDETTGTVAADARGDADGTLEGDPTWTAGTVRGALSFDGDDGVRVTNVAALMSPAVTYATWVRPTAFPNAYNEIMAFMRDDRGYRASVLLMCDGDGHPWVQFQNGSAVTVDFKSPTSLATGRWSFLAVSYDGAVVRLFVNGVLKGHADYAGGIDYGSGSGQVHFGGDLYYGPGGNAFAGLIDEPAVLDRALK